MSDNIVCKFDEKIKIFLKEKVYSTSSSGKESI